MHLHAPTHTQTDTSQDTPVGGSSRTPEGQTSAARRENTASRDQLTAMKDHRTAPDRPALPATAARICENCGHPG